MKQCMIVIGVIMVMLFSCTNQLEDTASVNENSTDVQEHEIKNEKVESNSIEIDFDYENAIEIRNANLWLKKEDLSRLMLDGEIYSVDYNLLESDTFSHVSMVYPAMILRGNRIFNILDNKQVLMLQDIITSLEDVWGKEVASEGYIWYGDVELVPSNFQFIDNTKYSQDMKYLCVSMHAFLADTFDSIVCIYDTDNKSIRFIDNPFWGQVTDIEFAPDGKYVAYAYYVGGDNSETNINILNYETMEHLGYIHVNEFVVDYENLNTDEQLDIYLKKMYWDQGQLKVDLEYGNMTDNKHLMVDLVVWK